MKAVLLNKFNKLGLPLALFLTGVIGSFGFPSYNIVVAGLISYAGLFYFVYQQTNTIKNVISTATLWGMGFHIGGLWWVAEALMVEGSPYRWAYLLAVVGLPFILTMFVVLVCLIYKYIMQRLPLSSLNGALLFAVLFSCSEWLRGYVFTGFPWNLPAYIWSEQLEILQSLSAFGAYGLSALTLLLCTTLMNVIVLSKRKRDVIVAGAFVLLFAVLYIAGAHRLSKPIPSDGLRGINIRVIQPNIAQKDKWEPKNYSNHLSLFYKLATQSIPENSNKTTLLILPETAVNDAMLSTREAHETLQKIWLEYDKKGQKIYLLTGALRSHINPDQTRDYFNSALLYGENGYIIDAYDKNHLVPFGEYMPFSSIIDLESIVGFSGFKKGSGVKTIDVEGLPSLGVAICYEIIFPNAVIDKKSPPNLLITITNDAWYGDTPGPYQHYMMARYRAIEEGLTVVRSANTGISGAFDAFGRELDSIPVGQRDVVTIPYHY